MNFKKTNLYTFYLAAATLLFSGSILFNGCKGRNEQHKLSGDTIKDGENIVKVNCSKCHQLVPVNNLPKDVWHYHTLPSMAKYFGIKVYMGQYYKDKTDTSGLNLEEWQAVVSYYNKMAPDTLTAVKSQVALTNDWAGFTLKTPASQKRAVFTTMAAINPYNHKIYTSDYSDASLNEWSTDLKQQSTTQLPTPAVNALFKDSSGVNTALLACIGRIEPIDFPNGKIVGVSLNGVDKGKKPTLVASELMRPVQIVDGDFNKDGLTDYVILAQGKQKGSVLLLTQTKSHTYIQNKISEQSGAVQAVTGDFNNDGWPDLMILYGTGDEGLWMYLNNRAGGFTAKALLNFPPVYGSTSFQLADMDHDGKPDLIYTCGYNFHDSRVLKPYHGLYIFKNTGNWNFKQQYYYPINGCTKAIAADFDGDGDLDIATSAFFADMENNPGEEFIYFEQDKPGNFKPHSLPVSNYGRWMSMDVGDLNNDGKPDIVLGNYSTGFLFQQFTPQWSKYLPFIELENHTKKS